MGITCKQFGKMRGIMKKDTKKRINKIGQSVKFGDRNRLSLIH